MGTDRTAAKGLGKNAGGGLFDAPSQRGKGTPIDREEGDAYRALSGAAIAAAAVAAVSPLIFAGWWFVAVPVIGLVLAVVAMRDIAARPSQLAGRPLAIAALFISGLTLATGLTSLARDYAAELPEGFERMGYDVLQPAEGAPAASVPDAARALNGKNILLKGYIYPGKQQQGLVQFLLVRDQGDCCFGGNPKITDRVLVQLADTGGIDFSPRLTKVAGRFRVQPMGSAELAGGVIYHLDDAFVR